MATTIDPNYTSSEDVKALEIDFVNNLTHSIQGLTNALSGVRPKAFNSGSLIKTYKTTTTRAASRSVGEGEEVPITQIAKKLDKQYNIELNEELRRITSLQAIQSAGAQEAIADTDSKLLTLAQNDLKSDLFSALDTKSTTKVNAKGFQKALSIGLAKLIVVLKDYVGGGDTIAFVNPMDLYNWLGSQQITVQTGFGLQYIENFLNVNRVIIDADVKEGHVYITYANNIHFDYINMSSAAGSLFNYTTDQTGILGITHYTDTKTNSYNTQVEGGWLILPEYTDGIIDVTIQDDASQPVTSGVGK